MNLNVLNPGKAVDQAFEAPNPLIVVAIIVASILVSIASVLIYGLAQDLAGFTSSVTIGAIISFAVTVLLIYIIGFAVKGKEAVEGKLGGIASALSLVVLISIVGAAIWAILLPAIITPITLALMQDHGAGITTLDQLLFQIGFLQSAGVEIVNWNILAVAAVASGIVGIWSFIVFYKIIDKVFDYNLLGNLIISLGIFIILGILPI